MAVSAQHRIGRPPKCGGCGKCARCQWAAYMRGWNARFTIEERREKRANRSAESVARSEAKRHRPADHAERERVRLRTRRAIARGTLVRGNCERCGSPFTQAHHEDYSEALRVTWLCPYHHSERHRERASEQKVQAA